MANSSNSNSILEILEKEKVENRIPSKLTERYRFYLSISLFWLLIVIAFTIYDLNNYQLLICSVILSLSLELYIRHIKKKFRKGEIIEIFGTVKSVEEKKPSGVAALANGIQKEKREAGKYYRVHFETSDAKGNSMMVCFDTKFKNVKEEKIVRIFVNFNEQLCEIEGDSLIANYYNYEVLGSKL